MKKYIVLIGILIVLFSCSASYLTCWKIGWDLKWHKARCWSTEFKVDQQPIQEPTETFVPTMIYETSTPTQTDIPLEPSATPTIYQPYPPFSTPSLEPYPF